MKCFTMGFVFTIALMLPATAMAEDVAQYLQDVSVTIKADRAEGSGVLITRKIRVKKDSKETVSVNFVWTAAHVVENLRSTRIIIGANGAKKTIVEFRDAQIVKELVENGRKVGELKMDAKIILYSDSEDGHDLALLLVRKRGFVTANATFHLDAKNKPVGIGTRLFHVGSLLGQAGANSMTSGIMSQVGRVLQLGQGDGTIFDQTTCAAFPGSSGGGVFLAGTKKADVKYVGMLVRGAGETFNFIVPVRRMHDWTKTRGIEWAINHTAKTPSLEEIKALEPEAQGIDHNSKTNDDGKAFPFLIYTDGAAKAIIPKTYER